jgi:LAO/AO transport system kinase
VSGSADAGNAIASLAELKSGGKAALARALAQLEQNPEDQRIISLLDAAFLAPTAHVIGLTGPPGVGKSTLAGAIIHVFRQRGRSIAVIAVDPSSKQTGGALLGDRTRLRTDPADQGVFVRSMAARDQLGGLADLTYPAMVLMRALYDVVLIETVGVGQSETDVATAADTVVFCVQPGSGDALQFMKAGIIEIPDIVVVTKGDLGRAATRARADVGGALGLSEGRLDSATWQVPVLVVSASAAAGIGELVGSIGDHADWLATSGSFGRRRKEQAKAWVVAAIRDQWGREGLKRLTVPGNAGTGRAAVRLPAETTPFQALADFARRL